MSAYHYDTEQFKKAVKETKLPMLVDFWAPWCGPCRQMSPVVDQLADETEGDAVIAKVNVDENQELAASLGISTIPTFVIVKDGEIVKTLVGSRPKAALLEPLQEFMN